MGAKHKSKLWGHTLLLTGFLIETDRNEAICCVSTLSPTAGDKERPLSALGHFVVLSLLILLFLVKRVGDSSSNYLLLVIRVLSWLNDSNRWHSLEPRFKFWLMALIDYYANWLDLWQITLSFSHNLCYGKLNHFCKTFLLKTKLFYTNCTIKTKQKASLIAFAAI
jgi:hypothetical protein